MKDVDKKLQERKKALKEEFDKHSKDYQRMVEVDRTNHEAMRNNEARRLQIQGAYNEIQELENGDEPKEELKTPEKDNKK